MPHYDEEYKGHSISVDTYEAGKGWRWDYQIDSGPIRECKDRPLRSENIMRQEALDAAKHEIDSGYAPG